MKKLIITICLFGMLFSDKLKILKPINVRDGYGTNSAIYTYAVRGAEFEIIGGKSDYYFGEVETGAQKETGRSGWIWKGILKSIGQGNFIVLKQGCNLRSEPRRSKKTRLAYIINGATFAVYNEKTKTAWNWFKVAGTESTGWKVGYISEKDQYGNTCAKVIK